MLEVSRSDLRVLRCLARPRELDRLLAPAGALVFRVADDEALVLAAGDVDAGAELDAADGNVAVLDETDGWAVWTLAGSDAEDAFRRLSDLRLSARRPAFAQGSVVSVPGKVVAVEDGIHLLVPSPFGHRLRARIALACRDLDVREVAPRPLAITEHA